MNLDKKIFLDNPQDSLEKNLQIELPEFVLEKINEITSKTGEDASKIFSDAIGEGLKIISAGNDLSEFLLGNLDSVNFSFKDYVLENINEANYITKGSEGEIFSFKLPGLGECVILKKRYDKSKNEMKNHIIINSLEKEYNSVNKNNFVKTPKLIDHFNDGENEFLLMEYIKGKTLYTKILEKMSEELFYKYYNNISNVGSKKEFLYEFYKILPSDGDVLDFRSFSKLDSKSLKPFLFNEKGKLKNLDLKDDSNAESFYLEISEILFEAGIISKNPKMVEKINGLGISKNPYLEEEYSRSINSEIGIFSKEQSTKLFIGVRDFLNFVHENGFYHRDLGLNPRNLMLSEDILEDGTVDFTPYILDFGKSVNSADKNPYFDTISGGVYDNDDLVLRYFRNLVEKEEVRNTDFLAEGNLKDSILDLGEKNGFPYDTLSRSFDILFNNSKKMGYKDATDSKFLYDGLKSFLLSNTQDISDRNKYGNAIFFGFKNDKEFREKSTLNSRVNIFLILSLFKKDDLSAVKDFIDEFDLSKFKRHGARIQKVLDGYIDIIFNEK